MTTNDDLRNLILEMKKESLKSNEELRKDLKEDNIRLSKEVKRDNTNLREEVRQEIVTLATEVAKIKLISEQRNTVEKERAERMDKRIDNLEKEMKKAVDQSENRRKYRKEQEKRVKDFRQATGLESRDNEDDKAESEDVNVMDSQSNIARLDTSGSSYKSDWAKSMDRELSTNAKKMEKEKQIDKEKKEEKLRKKREEDEKRKKVEEMEKEKEQDKLSRKPIRLGNSIETGELHENSDWDWNETSGEWDGTVSRELENAKKKKDKKERIRRIKEETATKAANIVGLHPVTQKSINKFNVETENYSDAKIEAAREYLVNLLGFNNEELDTFSITDTQVSSKGDDVLYIAVDDQDIIR